MSGAEFVCDVNVGSARGDQKLWKIGDAYVVTSAVVAYSGPETYVFASDADGNITDWRDLPGSFRGDLDHDQAIAGHVESPNGAGVPIPDLSLGELLDRLFGGES